MECKVRRAGKGLPEKTSETGNRNENAKKYNEKTSYMWYDYFNHLKLYPME